MLKTSVPKYSPFFVTIRNFWKIILKKVRKSPLSSFEALKKKKLEKSSVYIYLHSILLKRKN